MEQDPPIGGEYPDPKSERQALDLLRLDPRAKAAWGQIVGRCCLPLTFSDGQLRPHLPDNPTTFERYMYEYFTDTLPDPDPFVVRIVAEVNRQIERHPRRI